MQRKGFTWNESVKEIANLMSRVATTTGLFPAEDCTKFYRDMTDNPKRKGSHESLFKNEEISDLLDESTLGPDFPYCNEE